MTTIYLVRHAEAEGNLYRRIHGWYNSLITENGFAQIKALEDRVQRSLFRGRSFDLARPLLTGAVTALGISVSTFGLTELIDKGYGAICYGALCLFALPMLTVGVRMLRRVGRP